MDERMEQSIQRGRKIGEKIGIELERTRELRAYMRNKAYDDLSNLFGFPEIEREIYRAKCNFW